MKKKLLTFSILIIFCHLQACAHADIPAFSAGLAAISSLAFTSFQALKCKIVLCCDERLIPKNMIELTKDLSDKLYGQHIVQKTVVSHIKGHLKNRNPPKALVLSFHGPTGVGKNFVSRIIAENLYKGGLKSKFVHLISATREFPHEGMVPFYKEQLKSWIESNVSRCANSMFIFDEVDKLPALLLDVIKPYLDYYDHVGGVDYRKAIFLFLSNNAGNEIAKIMLKHWKSGKKREALQLSDIENDVTLAAMNADNRHGLWHSQLISSHLITAYIPFLPLERDHVRNCIKDSLVHHGELSVVMSNQIIENVLKELTFFPDNEQLFSTTGCKRVMEKVDFVLMDTEMEVKVEL